jgi:hypothetical protein
MGHVIRLNVLGLEWLSANTHGEIVFSLTDCNDLSNRIAAVQRLQSKQ